jgi:chitinase
MFNEFKALKGVKRILSFGGWSFSTEHDTFPIFRDGVTAAQRQGFANNVASVCWLSSYLPVINLSDTDVVCNQFIVDQGLDGVDFDWEYPGTFSSPSRSRR